MGDGDEDVVAVPRAAWIATQERLARLEAMTGLRVATAPDADASSGELRTDRRALLKRGALLAAGTAAGAAAVAVGIADPAAAAAGDELVLGTTNTSAAGTTLNVNSDPELAGVTGPGLLVTDNGPIEDVTIVSAALFGHAQAENWEAAISAIGQNGAGGVRVTTTGTGTGVLVDTDTGLGMMVLSHNGRPAVWAFGGGTGAYGLMATGGGAGVRFLPADTDSLPPPLRSDAHNPGEVDIDGSTLTLWCCTEGGSPGTWVRLAGTGTAGALSVLAASVRVYDSRPAEPPTSIGPKSPLVAEVARAVDVTASSSGVPDDANAVLVNLTAVPTTPVGYLSAYRYGIGFPGTSTLNWSAVGAPVANSAVVALAQGRFNLFSNAATDIVVDVIGYYR